MPKAKDPRVLERQRRVAQDNLRQLLRFLLATGFTQEHIQLSIVTMLEQEAQAS